MGRRTRREWCHLRDYYCKEYYRATQRLGRLHYADGRAELAVPLYKGLLKAEPTLEDVVRDLHSLIRKHCHLHQALREAYADFGGLANELSDIQPKPETVALFNSIRQELEAHQTCISDDGVEVR